MAEATTTRQRKKMSQIIRRDRRKGRPLKQAIAIAFSKKRAGTLFK